MRTKLWKKIVLTLLGAIVLLLALLVAIFFFWLGPTAETLVENIGTKALGTRVDIESLSIDPRRGTLDLQGFQIGTYEGFGHTNSWELLRLHVALDVRSLFSDTILIHTIEVDSPHFTYEQNEATDNISEFIRHIQAFAKIDPDQPKEEKAKEESEKRPKKVIVEALVINDMQMRLANTDRPELDIQLVAEQLTLSLTNGLIQLTHLTLSNPGHLLTPNLFELESIDAKLDPASLYSDPLEIEDVQVSKPHFFLEQNPETDTVAEFMKIADRFAAKAPAATNAPSSKAEEKEPVAKDQKAPAPFELRNFEISDIQLKLLDTTRTNAPATLRTMAAIGRVSVKLADGSLKVEKITVPNSPEFANTNLFQLASINIAFDPASIFSSPLAIKEVFLDSPKIHLEQTESAGNLGELLGTIDGFKPEPAKAPNARAASVPAPGKIGEAPPAPEPPVVLDTLLVTNLSVHITVPPPTNMPSDSLAGKKDESSIKLLSFELLCIEPRKGLLEISKLDLGNPPGFANKNLIQAKLYRMDFNPGTIQSNVFIIEEILIDQPKVAYERKLATDNIAALQELIDSMLRRRKNAYAENATPAEPELVGSPAPGKTRVEAAEPPGKKVVIDHLKLNKGVVRAKISKLPTIPVIPLRFEINNLGKDEGGTTFQEASSRIFGAFYDAILSVVGNATGLAGDTLKGAGNAVMNVGGSVSGTITDLFDGKKEKKKEVEAQE